MVRVWLAGEIFAVLFSLAGCRDHGSLPPENMAVHPGVGGPCQILSRELVL